MRAWVPDEFVHLWCFTASYVHVGPCLISNQLRFQTTLEAATIMAQKIKGEKIQGFFTREHDASFFSSPVWRPLRTSL